MMGGGRRDEAVPISSSNVFAALGSFKKKKKSAKEQGSSKSKGSNKEPENVFWAPAPLTVKSWADVDDEDDDDYYATTAPPESVWAGVDDPKEKVNEIEPALEETDSEEEGFDEVDDDVEEEHATASEMPIETEPLVKKPNGVSLVPKDTERQLSKKELKKKGLEELDAVLAELGYTNTESNKQDDAHGISQEKKEESANGDVAKKDSAPGEGKTAKKKKKKDKLSKGAKESQEQTDNTFEVSGTNETAGGEKAEETSTIDVKERLKKAVSIKKKKSSKEMDAASRAAANEAAARNVKLAASKKKEKNHYNQQPVR